MPRNVQRRQQILEALAQMLEDNPGDRITTARLAARVGVSEAALYRHFPSKAKMFEELIQFIEDTLFQRIALILQEEGEAVARCNHILYLLITFAERNPGISRLLTGEALTGETERLRHRVNQVLDRVETQIRQVLREAELREALRPMLPLPEAANLLFSCAEGRISQFVRSEFKRSPSEGWDQQYSFLMGHFFREVPSGGSGTGTAAVEEEVKAGSGTAYAGESSAVDAASSDGEDATSSGRESAGGGFS